MVVGASPPSSPITVCSTKKDLGFHPFSFFFILQLLAPYPVKLEASRDLGLEFLLEC